MPRLHDSSGRFTSGNTETTEERFWLKVNKNGPIPEPTPWLGECWVWTGAKFRNGYGAFKADGHTVRAHRWLYEQTYGPIPNGFVPDHLCRVRNCVRQSHLEIVTYQENTRRGNAPMAVIARSETCGRGHPRNEANVYRRKDRPGKWECRACKRERQSGYRENERETVVQAGCEMAALVIHYREGYLAANP